MALSPGGTKPLPEPDGNFLQVVSQPSISKINLRIIYRKFHSNSPEANELNMFTCQ